MIFSPSPRNDATFWGASTLAITLAIQCSPAQAEAINRIDISGHVAPRCWAGQQTGRQSLAPAATLDPETVRATRCTQGTPRLAMRIVPNQNQFPHRTAVEIVVTPQL
jgi:hypothetical protein